MSRPARTWPGGQTARVEREGAMGVSNRVISLVLCGAMSSAATNATAQAYCPRDVTRHALAGCVALGQSVPQSHVPVAQQLLPHEVYPYTYAVPPVYAAPQ